MRERLVSERTGIIIKSGFLLERGMGATGEAARELPRILART